MYGTWRNVDMSALASALWKCPFSPLSITSGRTAIQNDTDKMSFKSENWLGCLFTINRASANKWKDKIAKTFHESPFTGKTTVLLHMTIKKEKFEIWIWKKQFLGLLNASSQKLMPSQYFDFKAISPLIGYTHQIF